MKVSTLLMIFPITIPESILFNALLLFQEHLESLTEENFRKHLNALILRKSEKPKKLNEECHKYFTEIVSRQYNFDRGSIPLYEIMRLYIVFSINNDLLFSLFSLDNIEVNFLKTVSKANLVHFYLVNIDSFILYLITRIFHKILILIYMFSVLGKNLIDKDAPKRKKLSVRVLSKKISGEKMFYNYFLLEH